MEQSIAKLADNKADGLGSVSAEFLKVGGQACAAKLWELLCKVWHYAYWPQSWRGERLKELHKKGNTRICDHYRGLLISDHLGKAAASILYDHVDAQYHDYLPQAQCGAVKKKGGDFATHLLRTVMDHAASWGLSIVILFVDLVKAFDRILREVVLDWSQLPEQRSTEYLQELGFSHKQSIVLEAGSVLQDIFVYPHVRELLASMHTGSWFRVAGSNEFIVSSKGGRQGCKFGGIIFNLGYAKALERLYSRSEAACGRSGSWSAAACGRN